MCSRFERTALTRRQKIAWAPPRLADFGLQAKYTIAVTRPGASTPMDNGRSYLVWRLLAERLNDHGDRDVLSDQW